MGTAEPLGALPAFLTALTNWPSADEVVEALVEGPLAPFDPLGAHLSRYDGSGLVLMGRAGWSRGDIDGFHRLSLEEDVPSTRAFLDQMPVIGDGVDIEEFTGLQPHGHRLDRMQKRGDLGSVAAFPLTASGTSVGVVGLACRGTLSWSRLEIGLLEALGAAVGMWLTARSDVSGPQPTESILLSPRQCRILTCVLRGRTNGAIAKSLGYSNSTVKQDISRAMRQLGTTTRLDTASRAAALGLLDGAP